jgi:heme-degrading monooxygenase HmoA
MHTVVRIYSGKGAAEAIDLIIANKKDVKKLMHSVKGFIDYSVVKTEDGGFSVTVSKTEKASEAITAAAREWVMANAKTLKAKPPKVMGGKVGLKVGAP